MTRSKENRARYAAEAARLSKGYLTRHALVDQMTDAVASAWTRYVDDPLSDDDWCRVWVALEKVLPPDWIEDEWREADIQDVYYAQRYRVIVESEKESEGTKE